MDDREGARGRERGREIDRDRPRELDREGERERMKESDIFLLWGWGGLTVWIAAASLGLI